LHDSSTNGHDALLGSSAQADGADPTRVTSGSPIPTGDCNSNGILDSCEISGGTSADCNANGIPDECETTSDCNNNGIQDTCEPGGLTDCDLDGLTDLCEVAAGASDCNQNGIPDACEGDCDGDGVPNPCEIANCPPGDSSCAAP